MQARPQRRAGEPERLPAEQPARRGVERQAGSVVEVRGQLAGGVQPLIGLGAVVEHLDVEPDDQLAQRCASARADEPVGRGEVLDHRVAEAEVERRQAGDLGDARWPELHDARRAEHHRLRRRVDGAKRHRLVVALAREDRRDPARPERGRGVDQQGHRGRPGEPEHHHREKHPRESPCRVGRRGSAHERNFHGRHRTDIEMISFLR
jgi:hypothetical protein